MDQVGEKYERRESVSARITDVEVEVASIKQAVHGHTSALSRIEQKLEAPSGQPSWVAISGLFASVSGIMAAIILAFASTTVKPLFGAIVQIEEGMKLNDLREDEMIADIAVMQNDIASISRGSIALVNEFTASQRDALIFQKNRNTELERLLELAHSEAHSTHARKE